MANLLKEKAVKGVSWNLLERFALLAINFVISVILARLLMPEDFGLIGMITVFFTVAQVFVNSGFGLAYIQMKRVTDNDANTVFFFNLAVSCIIYVILWLSAPAIASFYEQKALISLMRVMAIVVIINSFNVIQIAQVTRNVDFKRKVKVTLVSTLLSGILGVGSACYGLGVWSLVIQQLSNRFLATFGLAITNRWKPSLSFSFESWKSMFTFGSWVLLAGIIRTIFDNIYILVIGKFFPAAQLGFYTQAKRYQQLASGHLAQAVDVVSFPIFSHLQDDFERLRNSAKKFLQHTLFFTMPVLMTLLVVAKPFIILLLTEKWAPMIPYLQLLCVAGWIYPISVINLKILMAKGQSKLNFRLSVLKNTLRIINITVMYRYGVIYIISGEVAVSFLALAVNTYYTKKIIGYGLIRQLQDISKILTGAIIAAALTYGVTLLIENNWWVLVTGTLFSIGGYTIIQYMVNREFFREVIFLKTFIRTI